MINDPQVSEEAVRTCYAELATTAAERGGCNSDASVFGRGLYGDQELGDVPESACEASLGCGNPTAVAELRHGEIVLDLGSGGGIDVILSARRVGLEGKAYGLDMTEEMLDLARANALEAGVGNVEFLRGHMENIPLPDQSVDVVISNCTINLSTDKAKVVSEVARVLRPGGRFAVTDVVADPDLDEAVFQLRDESATCLAGAFTEERYVEVLQSGGLIEVEVQETHRVHPHAVSAIIRARKPGVAASDQAAKPSCCSN